MNSSVSPKNLNKSNTGFNDLTNSIGSGGFEPLLSGFDCANNNNNITTAGNANSRNLMNADAGAALNSGIGLANTDGDVDIKDDFASVKLLF